MIFMLPKKTLTLEHLFPEEIFPIFLMKSMRIHGKQIPKHNMWMQ